MMGKLSVILSALLLLGGVGRALPGPGAVTGVVKDFSGGVIPGACITITPDGTGGARTTVSGDTGVFRIANLPPGRYELKAEFPGFRPASAMVELSAEDSLRQDFQLEVNPNEQSLTVVGEAPRDSLDVREIRECHARDVGEALAEVAGVWKSRKGGIANDVVLRGFQGDNINVLIDGLRIYGACPNNMDPPVSHVDFSEVDRIEIRKGPFEIKNQGCLGGVVSIVTRRPDDGWHANLNLAGGSSGFINPSAIASYATPRFYALAGYSFRRSKPYEDGSGKQFTAYANYTADAMDSDAFDIHTGWMRAGFSPRRNHLVDFSFTRQEADHILYPYLQMDADFDNTNRFNLIYEIKDITGTLTRLRFQAYVDRINHWMTNRLRTAGAVTPRGYSMGTYAVSKTYGFKLEAVIADLTAGMEAYRRNWDTTTAMAMAGAYVDQASIPNVNNTVCGFFGEYNHRFTDRLRLVAGARLDADRSEADAAKANTNLYYAYKNTRETSSRDFNPSGNIQFTVKLAKSLDLSTGVGRSVRVPDPQERFFALKRAGSDWVGNPEIKPIKNTGFETGLDFKKDRVSVSASIFYDIVSDFITVHDQARINNVPGVMNLVARSYANTGARMYGGETSATVAAQDTIFLRGSFSYVRGTKDPIPALAITDTDISEIPPFKAQAEIRYDNGRFFAEGACAFVAAQNHPDLDLLEQRTPGYVVPEVKVGLERHRFQLVAGVANLFNRFYYEHLSYQRDPFRSGVKVPEPGRMIHLNLQYRF